MPNDLTEMARAYNRELRDALQAIFTELNKGQTKKVLQNEFVQKIVDKYKVEHK